MNRRHFIQSSLAVTIAARASAAPKHTQPARKMNVLFAFSDQHRECSMPGKPYSPVEAPNLDKFRRDNFCMENCISNYPLCAPYRAILVSGKWPQQTGMIGNGRVLAEQETSLGHVFNDAGYHTGYVGKWHLDGTENHFVPKGSRQGFEDWHGWAATNNHYGAWTYNQDTGEKIQPPGWNATSMTDEALTFLKQQTPDKPWFLVVSWNPPHPPYNPPASDADPYPESTLNFRPNLKLGRPEQVKLWPQVASTKTLAPSEKGYYGGITGIDLEFARIMAALEANGQAENTIVVYTSDHGDMMGSHGYMNKIVPFEESCHVPFYIRIPGITRAGQSSKELFAAVDIFPTLCGVAGIPVPEHCAGRDISNIFRGGKIAPTDGVMLMGDAGGSGMPENNIPTYRGIRTSQYTYAVTEDGRWILYDNVADPFQQNNLAADPKYKQLMDKLGDQIAAWQQTVGDKFDLHKLAQQVSSYPS